MRSGAMVILGMLAMTGCSTIGSVDSPLTPAENETLLTGTVVSIQDAVPVDGGVTLVIRDAGGKEWSAYIPSFFRIPPPPQSDWELYEILRDLQPGDPVVLVGPKDEFGIRITALSRL